MTAVSIPHGGKAIAGCAAGTAGNATIYCEIAQIAASSPAASTSSIGFALRSPSGVNLSFATVTLLDRFGNGIAQYTPGGTVGSWALCPRVSSPVCNVAGSTNQTTLPAPINTTETLVLQVTPTAATGGTSPTGDVFLAVGLAPYSGSVTVNCP